MKLSKKKVFALALAVCLIATLSMGSLAWFTDSDRVDNDFFVAGSENENPDEVFSIDVWEDNELEDPADDEKWNEIVFSAIQPGDNFYKEVHVENTGAYDQYVRVTVTVTGASVWQDVFGKTMVPLEALVTNLNTNGLYNDRIITRYDVRNDAFIYEFYYANPLPSADDPATEGVVEDEIILFETVQIPTALDRFQAAQLGGKFEIDVVAEAVQTNNVGNNVAEAFKTVGLAGDYPTVLPDNLAEVLANAQPGDTIKLGPGYYDKIVITQDNITIDGSEGAVVGYINLNSKDDVTIQNVIFDAAGAQPGYYMTSTSGKNQASGLVVNITGAENSAMAADRPVIANCTFVGKAPAGKTYAPIHFHERNRKTEMTKDITVTSCTFDTNAHYYIYCNYMQKPGTITITDNTFGGEKTAAAYAIYAGSCRNEIVVDGNIFNNWTSAALFASNGDSKGHVVTVTNNQFNIALDGDAEKYVIAANNFHNKTDGAVIFEGNTAASGLVMTALDTSSNQAFVMISNG